MSVVLKDTVGRVERLALGASISRLDTEAESHRKRRRFRETDFVQALKRILRPSTMRRHLNKLEEEKRNEIEVSVNRTEASEAAFQAKTTEDRNEQLMLLLVSEKLYLRALKGVERLNEPDEVKVDMSGHIERALEGVRSDLNRLERHILRGDIESLRLKVDDLKITFINQETRASLEKLANEHQIDKMTYRIFEWLSLGGAAAVTGVAIAFPPVQGVLFPLAGAITALAGRMRWKARSEKIKTVTIKKLIRDRTDYTQAETQVPDPAPLKLAA